MKRDDLLQWATLALLCIAASGCVSCFVGAGPYGTVVDAKTGRPIAGAVVTMGGPNEAAVAATSDAAGAFELKLQPPKFCFPAGNVVDYGPGSFSVSAPGYESRRLAWGASSTGPLRITLEKQK
ncbi:MAG TPA: carboxypeptidase regulatory-like domain-containing protein [Burkholderiales bacterium]|nr:carboxypeptidase regulatory-like domain-containing protein [Burkholderiales bacterium]